MKQTGSRLRQLGLTLLTALLIVSCNGGGGFVASGGIGGTGVTAVSVGPITKFGSIFVNGVEYDLKDATIIVNGSQVSGSPGQDGNQVAADNLAVGQVVRVNGTVASSGTTGTATQVSFNADVNGPVNSVATVDASTKELTVLGQPVIVDSDTQFVGPQNTDGSPFSLDDLTQDMVVEISGLANADGKLHATYLKFEKNSAGTNTPVEVTGTIKNLDSPSVGNFTINGLTVNYTAADTTGLPRGTPADGQVVDVKGVMNLNGVLQAQKITLESEGLGSGEAQSADIEGFITSFTSSTSLFTVDSQSVQATTGTVYVGGLVTDLGAGVKVEVKGTLQNGVLTADRIVFKDDAELEGNVASVNLQNDTLTLTGLPGVSVGVNSLTQLSDNLQSLSSLAAGENVKVRGRANGAGSGTAVSATELDLESQSPSAGVTLQGPVEGINQSIVTILGVDIDAHAVGSFSSGEASPTETQFLSGLRTGDVVKVEGTLSGSTVTWQNMELEK